MKLEIKFIQHRATSRWAWAVVLGGRRALNSATNWSSLDIAKGDVIETLVGLVKGLPAVGSTTDLIQNAEVVRIEL